MNKRNYMRELDRIIEKRGGRRPRVLLHSCCGPCSSSVLEYLTRYFDVTLLWYNPNLYPQEEFERRFRTQIELIEKMGLTEEVSVLAESWKHERSWQKNTALIISARRSRSRATRTPSASTLSARRSARHAASSGCRRISKSATGKTAPSSSPSSTACTVSSTAAANSRSTAARRARRTRRDNGKENGQMPFGICPFFYSSGKPWPRSVLSRSRAMPFFSHCGIGAPSRPAFSTILPSSVKLYQIATISVR